MRDTWPIGDAEAFGNAHAIGGRHAQPLGVCLAVCLRLAEPISDAGTDRVSVALSNAKRVAVTGRFAEPVGVGGRRPRGIAFAELHPGRDLLPVGFGKSIAVALTDRLAQPESEPEPNGQPVAVPEPDCLTLTEPVSNPVRGAECRRIAVRLSAGLAAAVPEPEPVRGGFPGPRRVAGNRAHPDAGRQLARASEGRSAMPGNGHSSDLRETDRARMVTLQIASRGVRDPETLRAMATVPRDRFVPRDVQHRAYEDGALSIGRGQTISQPYIVARSTAALELARWRSANPGLRPRILDVGTGSGYQAAILAEIGADVTSIEFDPQLASAARERLAALGYAVKVVQGDGGDGYAPSAPYAGIVVAAAAPDVPRPLMAQLDRLGTLVIPIGGREQQMLTAVRHAGERIEEVPLEPVVFVPLLGRYGFR